MEAPDSKTLTLMNRTHAVCELEYDLLEYRVSRVLKIYDEGVFGPLGLVGLSKHEATIFIRDWWGSRAIPVVRPHLEESLERLGVSSSAELAFLSHGLSLSDQYWMKDINDEVFWEKINFFNNPFSDTVGRLIMKPSMSDSVTDEDLRDPANTSDGLLPKRWAILDGIRSLIKAGKNSNQEPYNEVIATFLHTLLLGQNHFVPYCLAHEDGLAVSICPNMLADYEELVPAYYVIRTRPQSTASSIFEHVVMCFRGLGIDDAKQRLSEMIVSDYLIANYDRHNRNYGVIRNVDTLTYRMAPIFDSGSSLWADKEPLSAWSRDYRSKPFNGVPERQLALVTEWEWFDPSQLKEFVQFLVTTLAEEPFYHNKIRVALIQDFVEENIKTVSRFRDGYHDHPALIGFGS